MRKILFNDKYGLQRAAIDGTKPMTRRSVPEKWQQSLTEIFEACNHDYSEFWQHPTVQLITNEKATYKVGEVVAIAQSYKDVLEEMIKAKGGYGEEENAFFERYKDTPGWNNKMFVKSDLMPNRIRITYIKVERLQDISDEDCLKEGIICEFNDPLTKGWGWDIQSLPFDETYQTPKEAFAALIDKVSGRGTWDSNPFCFCYKFKLVK